MLGGFRTVRAHERRDVAAAVLLLFGLIASHAILETARDALFLSKIGADRLPWVYLAIAAASLAATQGQLRLADRIAGRAALALWIGLASIITFLFWLLLPTLGPSGLYALYIWSGVLTTLVLVHFWTLLGDLFTVTQAKRIYGVVGAGSVLGAIAGTALATALARVSPAPLLLLVSAIGMAMTAFVPILFRPPSAGRSEVRNGPGSLVDSARYVARKRYPRAVVTMLVCAAASLTLADFLFKRTVSLRIPGDELAEYLATVYLALNALSLVVQLFVVGWVVRRFTLIGALGVLPLVLLGGGVGLLLGGGLVAALVVKGADGSMRYSLHRTSTELLFVPLSEEARRRVKGFIDVVGHRGGQVVASLTILAAVAIGAPASVIAVVFLVAVALWLFAVWLVRPPYLDMFRKRVSGNRPYHADQFPELDVGSLETLIAALDSANDQEVLAALDVLEHEGKSRLIPGLILHHPSAEVVERALELFCAEERESAVPTIDRLLTHSNSRIRAAAYGARSALAFDERMLRMGLSEEESAEVRAAIMVNLIAAGAIIASDADDALANLIAHGSKETRAELARAVSRWHKRDFSSVLLELSNAEETEVREAAVRAMASDAHSDRFVPRLLELLSDEELAGAVKSTLTRLGEVGYKALVAALADDALPANIRWRIPAAVAAFGFDRAADVLLTRLITEQNGLVHYHCLRELQTLTAREPNRRLDRRKLSRSIATTLSRAYEYVDARRTLKRGAKSQPARATPGHRILLKTMEDKREHAVDRLFRLLGLTYPAEDFLGIHQGLASDNRELVSSSVELCENILRGSVRDAVVGLIDDLDDSERLAAGAHFHEERALGYQELLEELLTHGSEALQDMAAYHAAELRLEELRVTMEAAPKPLSADFQRALEVLAINADEIPARKGAPIAG